MTMLLAALALFAGQDDHDWVAEATCIYTEMHLERDQTQQVLPDPAQKICRDRYDWTHDESEQAFAVMVLQVRYAEALGEGEKIGLDSKITDAVVAGFTPDEVANFMGDGTVTPKPILEHMVQMLRDRGVTDHDRIIAANRIITSHMFVNSEGGKFVAMRQAHKAP